MLVVIKATFSIVSSSTSNEGALRSVAKTTPFVAETGAERLGASASSKHSQKTHLGYPRTSCQLTLLSVRAQSAGACPTAKTSSGKTRSLLRQPARDGRCEVFASSKSIVNGVLPRTNRERAGGHAPSLSAKQLLGLCSTVLVFGWLVEREEDRFSNCSQSNFFSILAA